MKPTSTLMLPISLLKKVKHPVLDLTHGMQPLPRTQQPGGKASLLPVATYTPLAELRLVAMQLPSRGHNSIRPPEQLLVQTLEVEVVLTGVQIRFITSPPAAPIYRSLHTTVSCTPSAVKTPAVR